MLYAMKGTPLLILLVIVFSCSKEQDFNITLSNGTPFNITEIRVGSGDNTIFESVDSFKSSMFEINKSKTINVTEPLLSITVTKYSNSDTSFTNSSGGGLISYNKLDKNSTNQIVINVDSSLSFNDPTTILRITLIP
jgi:hypothetical protein